MSAQHSMSDKPRVAQVCSAQYSGQNRIYDMHTAYKQIMPRFCAEKMKKQKANAKVACRTG